MELRLEIDARSSTWVGYLESSWCKLFADRGCRTEAETSVLKLLLSIAAAGLVYAKLVAVGAAVDVAGCYLVPVLPAYACTISFVLEAAHASPYAAPSLSCWKLRMLPLAFDRLEAREGKLHLFLC